MSVERIAQLPAEDERDPVAMIRAALLAAYDYLPHVAGDVGALAGAREALKAIGSDVAALVRTIDTHIITATAGAPRTETPAGVVEIRWSVKRSKWESVELFRHLLREGWGGDTSLSHAELLAVVVGIVEACIPLTGSLGWRVGALKERGIDTSQWCQEDPAVPSVSVVGGKT